MEKTVRVVIELAYDDGEFDPAKMAKLDLKDVAWKRMVAKRVAIKDIRTVTSENNVG